MISRHNIKIYIAVLLIVFACLQLAILNIKWTKSTFLSLHLNESERMANLSINGKVEESSCIGPVNLLKGHRKQNQGFLTIGLCTVPRSKASYLKDTLHSLLHHMTDEQKKEVVIIVFLGFHNVSAINKTLRMVENNFNDTLSTGGLQIVQPDIDVYPDFNTISKRTFNDALKRVRWRTKQNIDFAYLFGYSEGLSKYYMHLEDDVDAIPNYINEIKSAVLKNEQSKYHWFVLNFGDGFFGQLFRSHDLCMMKNYILLFQDQKPCDLLLHDLKQIQLHDFKNVKEYKGKFKHKGYISSLEGKTFAPKKGVTKKPLKVTNEKIHVSRLTSNPPADIETTFKTFSNFAPEYAYLTNNTLYFWATMPKVGDYYRVKLQSQVLCTRIAIYTGAPLSKVDKLENANVVISSSSSNEDECKSNKNIGTLSLGNFVHKFEEPQELKCLEIVMTQKQDHWVIISQIEIKT